MFSWKNTSYYYIISFKYLLSNFSMTHSCTTHIATIPRLLFLYVAIRVSQCNGNNVVLISINFINKSKKPCINWNFFFLFSSSLLIFVMYCVYGWAKRNIVCYWWWVCYFMFVYVDNEKKKKKKKLIELIRLTLILTKIFFSFFLKLTQFAFVKLLTLLLV